MKKITLIVITMMLALFVSACDETPTKQEDEVNKHAEKFVAYIPHNDVELNNYNGAQKLYDDPSSIIFCTILPQGPNVPLITIPIAGKLTSSTTTFFSPDLLQEGDSSTVLRAKRSVDGLFHPNPPPYRYGFTPGGQYVDFFNLPTFCTTALTKFQATTTNISVSLDQQAQGAQERAEQALKSGDKQAAQDALDELEGSR